MREIKFRAWDKRQKQMSGIFTIADITQYEHIFERMFNNLARFNDLIWLEYTGLKDKNGKEIYEGYIVKMHWLETGSNRPMRIIREVKWNGNGYGNVFDSPSIYKIHVIGNIYENPELLEGI